MATTNVSSALRVTQWAEDFFEEYVRENQFSPYMGTSENSVIQVKEDLTKKQGDSVTLPFVTRIAGGVSGNATLEGNEAVLNNYGFNIPVDVIRNAVVVTEMEEQRPAFDIMMAAKSMLKNWAIEKLRGGGDTDETSTDATLGKFGIIDNLMAFYDSTSYVMYRDATEAQKDAWDAANTDRLLFGSVVSNDNGDHSAGLALIDSSADKLSATNLSLAKRLAKKANPRIRPIRTKDGEEWFIYFANSLAFANLKVDSTITQANREGWVRYSGGMDGGTNPIFRDSDLVYDGVIVREVPEIPYISNVGDTSSDVAPGFLCGAQALGLCWAKRTKATVNQEGGTDYEFRFGAGIRDIRGVRKNFANGKQWGVFTHYTYGQA